MWRGSVVRRWSITMGSLSPFGASYSIPPLTIPQIAAVTAVVLLSVLALTTNIVLFIGQIYTKRPQSGFEILVLNLFFVNFCLTLLIYPYDVVAYFILERSWPYSATFCHVSTFFKSFLPFIGCWSVAIMTLHQLVSLFGSISEVHLKSTFLKYLQKFGRAFSLWILGLAVHCPITYSIWTLHEGHFLCDLEGDNGLLHDSIWDFWIPFALSTFTLTAILVVTLATNAKIPQGESTPPAEPIVHWSIKQEYPPQHREYASNTLYDREQLDANLIQVEKLDEGPCDLSSNEHCSSELHLQTIRITVLLTCSLAVFMGPYCIFLMLFHFSDELDIELSNENIWIIGFTLMWCKPLVEPLLLLCFEKYRNGAAFWKWGRTSR